MANKSKITSSESQKANERTRDLREQVAALCYRKGKRGNKEVLLVTSRDTGRWIIPKGWPMKGKDAHEAAAQEAWEEAGVKPDKVGDDPLGSYQYDKVLDDGSKTPVEAKVFPVKVRKLKENYPEADERLRDWMSPRKAARLVSEPELKALLKKF